MFDDVWDEEAIEYALESAKALSASDPVGARHLRARARAAQRRLALSSSPGGASDHTVPPYDPMRLYARMAKFYGWSLSEMERMHFPTFFGFVREAQLLIGEEQERYNAARRGDEARLREQNALALDALPHVQPYQGEVIAYGR